MSSRRVSRAAANPRTYEVSPEVRLRQQMREYLAPRFEGLQHEIFVCVFLDAERNVLGCETLSEGDATNAQVSIREVAKRALALDSRALVVAHNHPSGCAMPSLADELITGRLKHALIGLDVQVLEHLIFAGPRCYSFAEAGVL